MQGYRLPDHVGFGLVEDEPVFLDLSRDRYYRLDPGVKAAFRALACETASDRQKANSARRLLEAGLIVPAPTPSRLTAARCSAPDASALDLQPARARPSARLLVETWWRLAWARKQLRRRRLASMIRALRTGKHRRQSLDDRAKAEALAAGFIAARRMVPFPPNCLPDSLALAFFLARRGHFPELVFGVKLDPFAAHCWVQTDRLVLNDSCDTIDGFVPVLIV